MRMNPSRALRLCAFAVLAGVPLFAAAEKQVIFSGTGHDVYDQEQDCGIGVLHLDYWWRERVTQLSDGNGGYHYQEHFNIYNFHAVDDSGTEYSGSEMWNYTLHVGPNALYPAEEVLILNMTGLSHGSGPNVHIKWRYKLTINAPGQATVQKDIVSVECIPD